MGVVFQARHIFLKTAHAIKVILPDLVGNDPMLVTRFRQEALAAAAIRHQNIIAVTDFGVVRGTMPFLVMEFVSGQSLHDILGAEGALPPARALEILAPVGSGVAAAHRQNIVHRDLKPLNIMIQDGMPVAEGVKVLDFGLAKIKSGELLGSFVQAKTSGLMGSPFYMAPEQWSDEEPDARADIYSLGVILYQMLGGDVPFKGTSIPSIMKKHLTNEPPSFSTLGVQVPPEVERVVRHALEKEADNRPPSVEAFIGELREAIAAASASLKRTSLGGFGAPSETDIAATPGMTSMPPPGATMLRIQTNPPGSRVYINNVSVGITDEAGELVVPDMMRGRHRVHIMREGYAEWEREVECNGGECRIEAQLQDLMATSLPPGTPVVQHSLGDPFAGTISSGSLDEAAPYQSQAAMEAQRLRQQAAALDEQARQEDAARRMTGELETSQARTEREASQRAETEASERRALEESHRRAAEEAHRRAAEEAQRRAVEEQRRAEEAQRRAAEEAARQRAAQEQQEREERERREQASDSVSAQVAPESFELTQPQRKGVVTQQVAEGASSASGQAAPAWQQQSAGGFEASATGAAQFAPKKGGVPATLIAAIIGVVLIGGGFGAWYMLRSAASSSPAQTAPPETPPVRTGGTGDGTPSQQADFKPEFISIPGGTFQMGRDDGAAPEAPVHTVTVGAFSLEKTEVTNAEYADFVRETGHKPPGYWSGDKPYAGSERLPVTGVSFEDATKFAAWRSKRDGVKYRLPTEEEWEYAARGGDQNNLYPWGNEWTQGYAGTKDSGAAGPKPVGSYAQDKSRWGVLDMAGNVYEWTATRAAYYPGSRLAVAPQTRGWVVIRGGAYVTDYKQKSPTTYRDWFDPATKEPVIGFRLVRVGP
jgi:formylglycine-generating enzyme required for sulfatase activity